MNTPNPDELDVQDMRRLAQGHETALNDLMERHAGKLFHYLVRCLHDEDDAADLAQETFVKLYQSRDRFDVEQRFSTWLYAIARYKLIDGHLYGHSDRKGWTCLDFMTGEPKWQEGRLEKGAISAADGMLYLLGETTGTCVLLEASPAGWREHGRFTLAPQTQQRNPKGRIWVHPVIANGRLYLRDQEYIHSYDILQKT